MRKTEIEVIYEDEELLVVRKSPQVPTQSGRVGEQDMVSLLKNYRAKKKEEPFIGLVHRLDQPVEGVMVFGKTKEATAHLSKQVQNREIAKEYLAIVEGWLPVGEEIALEDYLLKDAKTNSSKVVEKGTPDSKIAKLSYRVLKNIYYEGPELLEEDKKVSLLRVHLETGRHHQIRVQLSHGGFSIVGDRKYGNLSKEKEVLLKRWPVALCSCHLAFIHPKTGEKMEFEIEPKGDSFASILANDGLR